MTDLSPDDRLPTALWVDAHLRQLALDAVPYYVVNKGAFASGTVLLKLNGLENGCLLLQQQRDLDGIMGWMALYDGKKLAEEKADEYISRAVDRDPDLWVIEIEDRGLKNPFEGNVF